MDEDGWDDLQVHLAKAFRSRTRAEWTEIFDGSDACVTPVLAPGEAADHLHNQAREGFVDVAGIVQPAPAPRFSRTGATRPGAPSHTDPAALAAWGLTADQVAVLGGPAA
jgi:alpha-methylacyl-CoA racemase